MKKNMKNNNDVDINELFAEFGTDGFYVVERVDSEGG